MKHLVLLVLFTVGFESSALAYDIPAPGPSPQLRPQLRLQPTRQAQPQNQPAPKEDDQATATDNRKDSEPKDPIKKLNELQNITIEIDDKANVAKLVIPNSMLRALQAENVKQGEFTTGSINNRQPTVSRFGTVLGGLLMTLAALCGGLWLVQSRRIAIPRLAALASVVLLSGLGTASWVFANAGPPPETRSLTSKILKFSFVTGQVQVETTNESDRILLILPKSK